MPGFAGIISELIFNTGAREARPRFWLSLAVSYDKNLIVELGYLQYPMVSGQRSHNNPYIILKDTTRSSFQTMYM